MSELRTERVIERAARPEWGRLPVAVVVVLGVLLAAIVGLTSNASPWSTGEAGRSSPPPIVGEVLPVAVAVGLCVLLGLIWIHTPHRATAKKKRAGPVLVFDELGSSLRSGSLVLIGGMIVVVALVSAFWFLLDQATVAQPPPQPPTAIRNAGALPPVEPAPAASPAFDRFLLGLIVSVAVGLPLALVARHRLRITDPEQKPDDVPESVVRAVGDSIDQIERDKDARRAIIRAYAQMEHAFDDAGIPRRPSEAPFEYLGRALRGLRVSPPAAGRLAALFERARFSQHVVDAGTKHEAVGALREVERQMQAPPS